MPKFGKLSKTKSVSIKSHNESGENTAPSKANGGNKKVQGLAVKRTNEIRTTDEPQKKRSVLTDVTNPCGKTLPTVPVNKKTIRSNVQPKLKINIKTKKSVDAVLSKLKNKADPGETSTITSSQESTNSEVYETAPEDSCCLEETSKNRSAPLGKIDEGFDEIEDTKPKLPENVTDYDAENRDDPMNAPEYAQDIFQYYKDRETLEQFHLKPYLHIQPGVTTRMRAILVDWLVELQENFELNHETLYLAVKLIDMYLAKVTVPKEKLQLLGATTVLIACKYEERTPPIIADFLYVCDDAYSEPDLLQFELDILKELEFELGAPLSYRFLRRYAKVDKLPLELLTLSRYILEVSLHDYDTVFHLESLKAAGSLLLALRMKDRDWNPQLTYYTGYKKEEVVDMAKQLNELLHNPSRDIKNVFHKYSHPVFFEVAHTLLIDNTSL